MRSPNSHKKKQPSSSKQTTLTFQRGELVEIVSQDDGFEGSYYAANIISSLGNNDYIIQYKTLVKEDNSGLLREVMSANNIQKLPDKIDVTDFSVGDIVDAYDKDGWWVGKIVKKSGSKYYVYFKGSGERNAYPISLLRVHQEWVDGKWVRNCCQK
uniref:protein AGENET DOMAIN (AGD)-CONTAINING P1 n=1 Tax=Erigeron canadensis TaxID=72917 RepID=UPI001CB91011|nr:protein AGENET DOMAIN (AGD)-CONTAINING P1 [Erigeron canadensis]